MIKFESAENTGNENIKRCIKLRKKKLTSQEPKLDHQGSQKVRNYSKGKKKCV